VAFFWQEKKDRKEWKNKKLLMP